MGKNLTDGELSSIIAQYIRDGVGYKGESSLVEERIESLKTFYSEPYGDERKGKSTFVTSEARDAVNWMLPNLIDVFMSSSNIVEFKPHGPEDEATAKQATDYVNFIFWEDNRGYEIMRTAFQDALITKDGYIKWYWDDSEETKKMYFEGLDREQVAAIEAEDGKEIVEKEEYIEKIVDPMGQPIEITFYNVTVEETGPVNQVKLQSVAPEDIIFDRQASNFDNIRFIAQECRVMRSELLEMGYNKKKVMELPRYSMEEYDVERERRFYYNDITNYYDYSGTQSATDLVLVYECYAYIDYDNDGIAELRKIVTSDDVGSTIFENEEVDEIPFAKFGAIPQPHVWSSRSLVDECKDIQRVSTTLMRNLLDNLYKSINPRYRISNNDKVALLDLMRDVPGGLVRASNETRIEPLPKDQISPQYFEAVEGLIPSMLQKRTGITSQNQGLDPEQVNRTAFGVSKIMQAGMQRQKMMAREFAETGMQRLFKGIYGLVVKHQDRARMIRLNNEWIPIDPTKWPDNFDTRVTVGIGTGDKEKQLEDLAGILTQQKEGLQQGVVTYEEIYNTVSRMLSLMGYKNASEFFLPPNIVEQNKAQQGQQPNPAAQLEQAKMQLEQQKLQLEKQKIDIEAQKAQMDARNSQAEIGIKAQETQADILKKQSEAQKDMTEAEIKAQSQSIDALNTMSGAQINATTEVAKNIADIVGQVARGEIPRETGISVLVMTYGLTNEQADIVMGRAGSELYPGQVAIDRPISGE